MKTPQPEPMKPNRPDPMTKPPVETKPVKPPEPMKKPNEVPVAKGPFPRRALLINVSNYVYANPIGYGTGQNFEDLRSRLANRLQFPLTQVTEVSDGMRRAPGVPAVPPPVKPVIEQAISDFLAGSRAQDRVLVYFAGHAIDIENEAYLAPLEGDLEKKETLIPLTWVYKQLESCKARQKVLILDVCRLNPAQGMERPGGGPMSKKLDELLQRPPGGVQVWSACVEGQSSYENPEYNTSYFLEKLNYALVNNLKGVPTADEPLPLNDLVEAVNKQLKAALDPQKKVQTSRLSGVEAAGGVAYNPDEPLPNQLVIKPAPAGAEGVVPVDREVVKKILDEIEVPPVKKSRGMGAAC